MYLVSFYVPEEHFSTVTTALFNVGAGRIGKYDSCAWHTDGIGQFRPLSGSDPFIGRHDTIESLPEIKVEMVCEDSIIKDVLTELINVHPYETPAYHAVEILTMEEIIRHSNNLDIMEEIIRHSNNLDIYEKKSVIGYSAIGKQGVLKIVSIMNFLQDTASEHAALMGISGFDLVKENLGWVIFRYHIEITDHPNWQDEIFIRTDRFSCKNLYEIRNFKIIKKNNADIEELELVNSKVCWVMINKKNGRPVRLSKFMRFMQNDKNTSACNGSVCNNNRDVCSNNGCVENKEDISIYFPDIIQPKKIDYKLLFKVRMHDLDLNGHVNNAIFVEWGVETVPENIASSFFPSIIDVVFNKESLYGDIIISNTEIKKNESGLPITLHSIIREQDNEELARLNIIWKPLLETNLKYKLKAV